MGKGGAGVRDKQPLRGTYKEVYGRKLLDQLIYIGYIAGKYRGIIGRVGIN